MADIIQNRINGIIAERITQEDLESAGFKVFPSKRAGYDNISILTDSSGRIEQAYVVEVKHSSETSPLRVKLSTTQDRLKKLCKKTRLDHLTVHVNQYQIQSWLSRNAITEIGGAD